MSNPSGLCQCGCGRKTNPYRNNNARLGHVKGEPRRFVKGHGTYIASIKEQPCRQCGKPFRPKTTNVRDGFGFYCSQKCHYDFERAQPRPWSDRFWSYVDKNGPLWNGTPCWVWTGDMYADGYGRMYVKGKGQTSAYSLACELAGKIRPYGYQWDHLCRNHSCVNPDHLEAVTPRENLMRGKTHTASNSAKTHCIHGHEFTPENTYYEHGWRECKECRRIRARKYKQQRKSKVWALREAK